METEITKKYTSWTEATISPWQALIGLTSCLNSGKNAWIEIQKNGEQDYPVKIKNPALNNPFNWTMMYGLPRNEKQMSEHPYYNETEKDLTYNWEAAFATKESAEEYITTGKPTKGLLKGMGTCIPVKIKDLESIRDDGYKYGAWITFWKPKDEIPYWIPDKIDKVYVVCFNDEPYDKENALVKAANFLLEIARKS